MAKREVVSESGGMAPRFDRGLEAWRIAHDVRRELANAMLRLRLFERTHASRAAHQAAGLISVALTKLDELEEENAGASSSLIVSKADARNRVGHS
jgi:hypothetical protein